MITLLLTMAISGLILILFKIAIVCVILWGIYAILCHFGFGVHPVVRILGIVVISILVIYFLYYLLTGIL